MRVVLQRVAQASVSVHDQKRAAIGPGLLVLLGVGQMDTPEDAVLLANKIVHLRIFDDAEGKLNRSLLEIHGEMLVVSQFTLYADARKGRRPSFVEAARPEMAAALYEAFVAQVRRTGVSVQTGEFQTIMDVALINQGPVTILLDSQESL